MKTIEELMAPDAATYRPDEAGLRDLEAHGMPVSATDKGRWHNREAEDDVPAGALCLFKFLSWLDGPETEEADDRKPLTPAETVLCLVVFACVALLLIAVWRVAMGDPANPYGWPFGGM